eukprot:COSAG02_NODE_11303_length_1751_cov_5.776634_2_plen_50_part_00
MCGFREKSDVDAMTLSVSARLRAHGCRLAGEMGGGGLHSVAWASVITLT